LDDTILRDRTVEITGLPVVTDPNDVYELEKAIFDLFSDVRPPNWDPADDFGNGALAVSVGKFCYHHANVTLHSHMVLILIIQ
jgi:hypothetical protein